MKLLNILIFSLWKEKYFFLITGLFWTPELQQLGTIKAFIRCLYQSTLLGQVPRNQALRWRVTCRASFGEHSQKHHLEGEADRGRCGTVMSSPEASATPQGDYSRRGLSVFLTEARGQAFAASHKLTLGHQSKWAVTLDRVAPLEFMPSKKSYSSSWFWWSRFEWKLMKRKLIWTNHSPCNCIWYHDLSLSNLLFRFPHTFKYLCCSPGWSDPDSHLEGPEPWVTMVVVVMVKIKPWINCSYCTGSFTIRIWQESTKNQPRESPEWL